MQAVLTTTLASETAADHKTEDSETITTDHRTMAGSEMETAALTVASAIAAPIATVASALAITTAALTVVSAAAIAAPATTVVSETAAVRTTAVSEAEEATSSVATAAAA